MTHKYTQRTIAEVRMKNKICKRIKSATIYEAAKMNGIKIPILCHDKKLKPFGACRMCLVEVEQMKGRQIPACTTPATEGMIIRTSTPDIVKARKMVLELLLLNHPLDCPVCDKLYIVCIVIRQLPIEKQCIQTFLSSGRKLSLREI